jgi:hypothetical protein
MGWALEKKRGKPAEEIPEVGRVLSVAEMLAALRSSSPARRMVGGFMLARAIGTGLAEQGEDPLDVQFISAPQISKLIGAAIAGEAEALEEIETHVTTERPQPRESRSPEVEAN